MAYDPFVQSNPIVAALEQHRGRVEQTKENSARYAQAFGTFTTEGDGQFRVDEAMMFGCTFTEQPIVAYGFSLPDVDGEQQDIGEQLPRCWGGVRGWVKDSRGFYTGAFVYMVVDFDEVERTSVVTEEEQEAETKPPLAVFSDNFDRANSAVLGNGWQQVGGDFSLNTNRVVTLDATAWLGQGFGRKNLSVTSDLRTPDTTQPAVWAWGAISGGGPTGYVFAFSGNSLGDNLVLRVKDVQVRQKHYGTAGVAIGNKLLRLRMDVVDNGTNVTVKCYVDGALQFEYSEPSTAAPTGSWSGVGNMGAAGNQHIDNVVIAELETVGGEVSTPPAVEEIEVVELPVYVVDHDFTFTAIALKDLPNHLLI